MPGRPSAPRLRGLSGEGNTGEKTVARFLHRACALTAFALAGAAIFSGSAAAGLLGTGEASGCAESSQVFAPWGDGAYYLLVPGGAFESGTPAWKLGNGAKVVSGNEPYYVHERDDQRSLHMPSGSTAMSPTVCFEFGDWHARFFVRKLRGDGSLEVDILVRSALGVLSVVDGGYVRADGTWDPSPNVSALVTNVGGLLTTEAIAFRFRARGASFQIDDLYLDPWKRT
jgi:hypothetical protein